MPRSSSAEPVSGQSKRKGTRSVSTLTPTQLARKRANDREAQRAIRARTKEHIERLERELADLKSGQNRDRTVQELLRRNKALEEELNRLREHMGITVTSSSPYSAPAGTPRRMMDDVYLGQLTPGSSVYDDNLSSGSGTVSSPRMSPLPPSDYAQLPEYGQPQPQTYASMSNGCETWASSVSNPVLSTVSNPPSPGNCDDYNTAYMSTSVPASMMPARPRVGEMPTKEMKMGMGYEDLDGNNDSGFRLSGPTISTVPPTYVQQQAHDQHNHHHHHHHHQNSSNTNNHTSNNHTSNNSNSGSNHHSHSQTHSPQHHQVQHHQAHSPFSQPHAQTPHPRTDQWNMYPMFYQNHIDQRGPSATCVSR